MSLDLIALRMPRKRRRPTSKRPPQPPDAIAMRYAADVKRLLSRVHDLIRAEVMAMPWRKDDAFDVARVLLRTLIEKLLGEHVKEMAQRTALRVNDHVRRELSRVIGIPLSETLSLATIERFADANIQKITSLAFGELDRVADVVAAAQTQGLRVEELGKQLADEFDVSDSWGTFLARDQTLKLNGQIAAERQVQAGILRYTWSTSRDERVREEHKALDGTEQQWAVAPVTSADGRTNHPGQDYQCRCTASPILDDLLG